jgi:serine/threonine protein kinase
MLADRYVLGRVLGRGGFGITYLAWDNWQGTRVAIKEYFPMGVATRVGRATVAGGTRQDREHFSFGLSRFVDEGQVLKALLPVPGVVPVLETFQANGTAYLVMQYLEGETLKEYAARRSGKLPVAEALAVWRPILRTLTAVHARDWLHRDISPDNIFLSQSTTPAGRSAGPRVNLATGEAVDVVLLDFGSARQALGGRTQALTVVLKPCYAPIEQYRSKGRLGPTVDVYAASATLFELLTGTPPSPATDRLNADNPAIEWPSDARHKIPVPLQLAIEHGLALRSDERPASAAALDDEIARAMDTEDRRSLPAHQSRSEPVSYRPGVYSIGRGIDCEIQIADETVSAQHARVVVRPDGLMLEDAGSSNGTFIVRHGRSAAVHTAQAVLPGDHVRFGEFECVLADLMIDLRRTPLTSATQPPFNEPARSTADRRGTPQVHAIEAKYESPRAHSKWVVGLLAFYGVLAALCLVLELDRYDIGSLIAQGYDVQARADSSDSLYQSVGIIQLLGLIATAAAWIVWQYRCHRNLDVFGGNSLRFTHAQVAWAWFIPFLNLVRPYQATREIFERTSPQQAEASNIVGAWWTMWIISNALDRIGMKLYKNIETPQQFMDASAVAAITCLVELSLVAVAVTLVTKITRAQDRRVAKEAVDSVA